MATGRRATSRVPTFAADAADAGTYAAIHLAAVTGMRRGKSADCDGRGGPRAGAVYVVTTNVSVAGTVREGPLKTAKGRRVIDLDPATVALLRRWRLAQDPSPYVAPMHPRNARHRFDALVRDWR